MVYNNTVRYPLGGIYIYANPAMSGVPLYILNEIVCIKHTYSVREIMCSCTKVTETIREAMRLCIKAI